MFCNISVICDPSRIQGVSEIYALTSGRDSGNQNKEKRSYKFMSENVCRPFCI